MPPTSQRAMELGKDDAVDLNEVHPESKADRPCQHDWLAQRLNDLDRVFAPRVNALDASDPSPHSLT